LGHVGTTCYLPDIDRYHYSTTRFSFMGNDGGMYLLDWPSKEIKEPIQNPSDKIDEHFNKMLNLIEKEKLFTNPEFDLSMLAEKCELSANYLSQIINKKSGQNFYSLINQYRLEEAKKILLNPDFSHYSILSIGMQAGFKSKSSFYKVFKEKTGMTPSQFLKENKVVLSSK